MRRDGFRLVFSPMLFVMALLVLTVGCATYPGGVAPSTKPLTPTSYTVLKDVEGEDCMYYLFGLLPISHDNQLKSAIFNALENAKGADALIKVTVDRHWEFYGLFAAACTQVQGTAVQSH